MNALENFIEELRRIPNIGTAADDISDLIGEQTSAEFLTALIWIAAQKRSVVEKIDALRKLLALPPGRIELSMKELTGWQ